MKLAGRIVQVVGGILLLAGIVIGIWGDAHYQIAGDHVDSHLPMWMFALPVVPGFLVFLGGTWMVDPAKAKALWNSDDSEKTEPADAKSDAERKTPAAE
jgi:hypothetical protein